MKFPTVNVCLQRATPRRCGFLRLLADAVDQLRHVLPHSIPNCDVLRWDVLLRVCNGGRLSTRS